jgi:nucleotide-binding universal stress UspA family protein
MDPSAQRQVAILDPLRAELNRGEIFPGRNPGHGPPAISSESQIQRILVPVDAIHTKLSDFSPILLMARRLGATVTLLHCYIAPPSFDFAVGDAALADVSLHCRRVRTRLYALATAARNLYSNCIGRVALGCPSVQIIRQSRELKADLIAIPLPLDLTRWSWLLEELLDELVRKADCPVFCVPAQKFRPEGLPTSIEDLAPEGPVRLVAPLPISKNRRAA